MLVQPVHVDDFARGIELLLAGGRFKSEVLDLGGPRPLPFSEFLALTQTVLCGAPGRIVRVPLWPVRTLLALMEPALRSLIPVTAGSSRFSQMTACPPRIGCWSELGSTCLARRRRLRPSDVVVTLANGHNA